MEFVPQVVIPQDTIINYQVREGRKIILHFLTQSSSLSFSFNSQVVLSFTWSLVTEWREWHTAIMGMGLVEFHQPYTKNEFHVHSKNESNYYYVEDGFFETRHSIGRALLTLLHISFIASIYLLLTNHNWNLLMIGKFSSICFFLCPPLVVFTISMKLLSIQTDCIRISDVLSNLEPFPFIWHSSPLSPWQLLDFSCKFFYRFFFKSTNC